MGRQILYGALGFIIFGILGILVSSSLSTVNTDILSGRIALTGAAACVLFAQWMNKRGERKLETFSGKPYVLYGICGALIGSWATFLGARYFDPADSNAGIDLLCITAGSVLGVWVGVRLARRLGWKYVEPPTYRR